jgi:hypothetical protein
MKLLERIARSNGDLPRTVLALRLINEQLQHELSQHQAYANVELDAEDLETDSHGSENQLKRSCSKGEQINHRKRSGCLTKSRV